MRLHGPFVHALPPGPLLMLALLVGTTSAAQPRVIPCEAGTRRIELGTASTEELHELCISPGLSTTLLFHGAELIAEGVSVEGRERFSLVDPGNTTLRLVPSERVPPGARFRLTVRFRDGAAPSGAAFWLVVHPGHVEPLVEVYREKRTVESYQQEVREKESQLHQCQSDYTRLNAERHGPRGLAGLLAAGLLDHKGIATRNITESLTVAPGSVAIVAEAHSYRAANAIMVVLTLEPLPGMEFWRAARAVLEGPGRRKPRVSTLWQPEPLQPEVPNRRVVIEAEATEEESRGSFTLKVSNEDGTRSIVVSGVTFP